MLVKYVDILLSVSKLLKKKFPDVNIEIDKNNAMFKDATFYIQVIPLTNRDVLSDKRLKLTNVFITYVKQGASPQEKLIKTDELCESFNFIPIYNSDKRIRRKIPINKREVLSKDDMPTLKLTLNYYDDRKQPISDNPNNTYDELIGIIHLNIYSNSNLIDTIDIKK